MKKPSLKKRLYRLQATVGLDFRVGFAPDCAQEYSGEEIVERYLTPFWQVIRGIVHSHVIDPLG